MVSARCFRLLALVSEVQNEVEVVKPILQELEVMRLSCALGMLANVNVKDFEHDLLEASEFDDDFARFLRQELFGGRNGGDDASASTSHQVSVASVFGKQSEVKYHLQKLNAWDDDVKRHLRERDQGIYAVLLPDDTMSDEVASPKLVLFGWLVDCLFEPEHLRDTPTYILRFLTCLSSNVTCCLSKVDWSNLQAVVSAMDSNDMDDWKSYSVAFRVERQQDEEDSVDISLAQTLRLPRSIAAKDLRLVKGKYPAVVSFSMEPRTKKRITKKIEFTSPQKLGQWMVDHAKQYNLKWDDERWLASTKEALLRAAERWPEDELERVEEEVSRSLATVDEECEEEATRSAERIRSELIDAADVVFSVDLVKPSDLHTQRLDIIKDYITVLNSSQGLVHEVSEETKMILRLPFRLRNQMKRFFGIYESGQTRRLEELLNKIVVSKLTNLKTETPGMWAKFRGLFKGTDDESPDLTQFFDYMRLPLDSMKQAWIAAVSTVIEAYYQCERIQQVREKKAALNAIRVVDAQKVIDDACNALKHEWGDGSDHELVCSVICRMRNSTIYCDYFEEQWEPASERMEVWKLNPGLPTVSSLDRCSSLGGVRLETGEQILSVFTVQASSVVMISVSAEGTFVRRAQFPSQSMSWQAPRVITTMLRKFHRVSTHCDFDMKDRTVVLVDATGFACFYRFNEQFSSLEVVRSIDIGAKTSLVLPLTNVLLVDGVLYMTGTNGAVQSVNVRNQQLSRKSELKCFEQENGLSPEHLFSVLDGLALGSFSTKRAMNGSLCVAINVISSEDYRILGQTSCDEATLAGEDCLTSQTFGSELFVLDTSIKMLLVMTVKASVRSDSYRIQTVTGGAGESEDSEDLARAKSLSSHWMWIIYHLFEKFPVRGLLEANTRDNPHQLHLQLSGRAEYQDDTELSKAVSEYLDGVMEALEKLNKPLHNLSLTENHSVVLSSNSDKAILHAFSNRTMVAFLQSLVTFVPIQICRAEYNRLTVMYNGQDRSSDVADTSTSDLHSADIARSIRFGLLSPLLQSWGGQCVVITSMGKQSTGKSYFLNHLTGSSFAIAGARCTDGAWMCVRVLPGEVLLIVIDFEGLGSFERTEQEDVFLSVLNASISMLTVFRMEMRFDKEIDDLFSKFQKGSQLIKNESQLFRGKLFMSVKDVNPNDHRGVVHEFVQKFGRLLDANRENNFLTDMYAGQLDVNCSPPLGTTGYYRSLTHAQRFIKDQLCGNPKAGFPTGKAFLDCVRLVLAKISILDWTSMDDSTVKMKLAEMANQLPGIVRFGAIVPVSDTISDVSSAGKDDLIDTSTGHKVLVTLDEVIGAEPSMMSAWVALQRDFPLDGIDDGDIDLGVLSTGADQVRLLAATAALHRLFQAFLKRYVDHDDHGRERRLTVSLQKKFDLFLAFIVRRRRLRIQKWARSMFDDRVPDDWKAHEQQKLAPLQAMTRCLDRCAHCQLGCMKLSAHSIAGGHDCGTSHRCSSFCEYCVEMDAMIQAPVCAKQAGHEGRCECDTGDHTCGAPCCLQGAMNCGSRCASKAGHEGEHRCSVGMHKCGQSCLARNCSGRCVEDAEQPHTAHKCEVDRCLQPCVMDGCDRLCHASDHFHGHTEAAVAFAVEHPGKQAQQFDSASEVPTIHMCSHEHACPGMCQEDGICDVQVFLKKSSKTFVGARGSFQYTFQEMNGSRKKCTVKLAPGQQTHPGAHSCVSEDVDMESDEQSQHYCDVRCPCCSYFCQKEYGHSGSHKTVHGNMRNTIFMSSEQDIDLDDRKYQAGERGTAEMCNLYCSKMGRQHVHYLDCDQKELSKCIYTGGPEDMRRHCTRPLEPKPDHEMDEVLHERFWDTLGWEDPCTSLQEREEFAKCGYKCGAPDHDDNAVSYCVLPAWHLPEAKPTTGFDGFSYVSGHKFECTHTAAGDKIHHIFVLDCSGSMQGWPWDKLIAAFREYVHNRVDEGACQDLVSVVTFDSSVTIEYEAVSIQSMTTANVRFRGGGTSFSAGLRAANEVLSRVRFEAYKPVLVFFSDGHPADPHEGEQMAAHIQQSYNKYGLEAFAVGFGMVNLSLLQRVAQRLGGSYHHALTGAELKSTFYKISVSLGATTGLALTKPIHETLCVICQKELAAEATIVLMPCHHELHQGCFRLLTDKTADGDPVLCPSCRQEVTL